MLIELAQTLRDAGLAVREYDGWELRAARQQRVPSSGPLAIIVHHTASPASWDGERDADYIAFQCDVAPMANLYLDRSGQCWVLAAGASNTNGAGGPWGPIPLDSANSRVIGIEAGNDGIGEAWPDVMQDAYVKGVAALAERFGIPPRTSSPTTSGRRRARSTQPDRAASGRSTRRTRGTWTVPGCRARGPRWRGPAPLPDADPAERRRGDVRRQAGRRLVVDRRSDPRQPGEHVEATGRGQRRAVPGAEARRRAEDPRRGGRRWRRAAVRRLPRSRARPAR